MKKKKDDPDLHLKITLHDSIHHSNSQARKLPNCNHRFSSGTTRDLLPVAIFKNFAPSSLIAISNFKEEKMIHFALNRTMNRGKLCSLHRFTKFVKTSNLPNRSKSGSGSFEAEWKAIGSSNVISATNPQMNGPPRSLVAGYESDINRGQPFQDCSNSFRPVINL